MSNTITLKVYRRDPDLDTAPKYQDYQIELQPGQTVLMALYHILDNVDKTIAFRASCRSAVCGSCGMHINGRNRLACETQLSTLGSEVWIDPLPHLPVLKDLVVDMTTFWDKYERVRPYLITLKPGPDKERLQSPEDRKKVDEFIDCILCACCHSACSLDWWDKEYLGPAALGKMYRFVADSRDEGELERLKIVANEEGVFRCHTLFNCTEECPKKISPTFAIQELKKKVMWGKLTGKL
ncbi:succinate dehydrogenase / fumarate reductase, iron-sulfur subunit [Anaerolineae bacterium]|nr:succinate dehydrogenase / fumarate reductase, iron-sulfur subunit [Anaerolineae bacterium]